MKNIQVIDGALNCSYSVFAVTDEEFDAIFPDGTDIAFAEDFDDRASEIVCGIWERPVNYEDVQGIHGTVFFELSYKKRYFPTGKESELVPLGNDVVKPPENAYDSNGPKAPGLPGEDVGYFPPKGGPSWVPNPNPEQDGSSHGWLDNKGRVWCPTGPDGPGNPEGLAQPLAHGGPHWDVVTGPDWDLPPDEEFDRGDRFVRGVRNVYPRRR